MGKNYGSTHLPFARLSPMGYFLPFGLSNELTGSRACEGWLGCGRLL